MTDTQSPPETQDPIERAVAAARAKHHEMLGTKLTLPDGVNGQWKQVVLAVLLEIREPSAAMLSAGECAVSAYDYPTFSADDAAEVWRAMVGVLLRGVGGD